MGSYKASAPESCRTPVCGAACLEGLALYVNHWPGWLRHLLAPLMRRHADYVNRKMLANAPPGERIRRFAVVEYYCNGVPFAGRVGNRLIDTKHRGSELLDPRTGRFKQSVIDAGYPSRYIVLARRQVAAKENLELEWRFKHMAFLMALLNYFQENAPELVSQIHWVHVPLK